MIDCCAGHHERPAGFHIGHTVVATKEAGDGHAAVHTGDHGGFRRSWGEGCFRSNDRSDFKGATNRSDHVGRIGREYDEMTMAGDLIDAATVGLRPRRDRLAKTIQAYFDVLDAGLLAERVEVDERHIQNG